ncbi:MAG: PQQ-binding-like beta-propeller repeat protein, partial [Planctomycetes bacterium]|nr:PQQ-binding-like beta-propeller repeat protein [Planctomycetota bacterium]
MLHRLMSLLFIAAVAFGSVCVAADSKPPADAAAGALDALIAKARGLLGAPELIAGPLPEDDVVSPVGIFLNEPDDRTLRVLRRAEMLCNKGKWPDALAAYQVLIDDGITTDLPAGEGVYIPCDEYCRRRMVSLPPEAVVAYRTLNDAAARELYASALRRRSPALLHKVHDRFPISSVADDALKDAADLRLERGNYPAALNTYKHILSRMRPGVRPRFSPGLILVKAAACLQAMRRPQKADELLKLALSATATDPAENARLAALAEMVKATPPPAAVPADWGTFGGDNSHGRSPAKVALPGRLRWHQRKVEERTQPRTRPPVGRPAPPRPSRMLCRPAVMDGIVYYRTDSSVVARDLLRGTKLWEYKSGAHDAAGRRVTRFSRYSTDNGSLFVTAAGDRVYANILCTAHENGRQITRFKLVALEVRADKGEPKVAWERCGHDVNNEQLRQFSFASAPIVAGGRLFAGAMKTPGEDMYLCAFDAQTGALLWKTFVCLGQIRRIYNMRTGNGAAEMPAEKDGVVYLALNVGVVVAADAATGRPLWKNVYEQHLGENLRYAPSKPYKPNNPPIISSGRLYLLPAGSDSLCAFDLATGRLEWRHTLGGNYYHLLGVKNGSAIVSGRHIASIGYDGTSEWSQELSGKSAGRGVLAEDFALCPIEGGIEVIRLETGRFVGIDRPYIAWAEWLKAQHSRAENIQSGNLLIAGGKVIVTGKDRVQVFDERIDLEQVIAKLAASPDDPALHAELALHHLWQGRYADAAAEYEKAYELVRRQHGDAQLALDLLGDLFTIYMDLGDSESAAGNHTKALGHFEHALMRAPQQEGSLQASVRIGDAFAALGNIKAAIDTFQTIIREHPDESFHPNVHLLVQARVFTEARISELIKEHGRQHYAHYDAKAEEILEASPGEVTAALEVLRRYPNSKFLAASLLSVAESAVEQNDWHTAGGYLGLLLRRSPESAQASRARVLLAMCLEKQGITDAPAPPGIALAPPLRQQWAFQTNSGRNPAMLVDLAAETVGDLFYVILGKNLHCRRAQDGSLAWKNAAGWLGVGLRDPAAPLQGAQITEVMPDTPAERAGFEGGDVIIEFNGVRVDDTASLIRICGNTRAGTKVSVKVLRERNEKVLAATLGERPSKHDQVAIGYRMYIAGTVPMGALPGKGSVRRALVISRDRFIQCLDWVTGEALASFSADDGPFTPLRNNRPTRRNGLAVAAEKKLLSITPEPRTRGVIIIGGQFQAPQQKPSRKRAALWDITTGRELWRRVPDRTTVADPCVVGNVVVVLESKTGDDLYVTFRSLDDGTLLTADGPIRVSDIPLEIIKLSGGRVCVAAGREVLCYSVAGEGEVGRRIWRRRLSGGVLNALRLLPSVRKHGRELLVAATSDLGVEVLEAATGRPLWSLA